MFVVVNRIPLARPIPDELLDRLRDEFIPGAKAQPGFVSYRLIRASELELVVVAEYEDMESLQRISSEYASPWFEAHVKPLLGGAPERVVGELIASG